MTTLVIPVIYYVAVASEIPTFNVFASPRLLMWRTRGVPRPGHSILREREWHWERMTRPSLESPRATLLTRLTTAKQVRRHIQTAVRWLVEPRLKVNPSGHFFVWVSSASFADQVMWGLAYDERWDDSGTRPYGGAPPQGMPALSKKACLEAFPPYVVTRRSHG